MTDVVAMLRGLLPFCVSDAPLDGDSDEFLAWVNGRLRVYATLRTLLPELIGVVEAGDRLTAACDVLLTAGGEAFSYMAARAEFDAALDAWKATRQALAAAAEKVLGE